MCGPFDLHAASFQRYRSRRKYPADDLAGANWRLASPGLAEYPVPSRRRQGETRRPENRPGRLVVRRRDWKSRFVWVPLPRHHNCAKHFSDPTRHFGLASPALSGMEDTYALCGKSAPRRAKSATVPWRRGDVIVTRLPNSHTRPRETVNSHPITPIDNPWGPSYILRGAHIPVPPSSDQLRFAMLRVHLKFPHPGLPRA